MAKIKLTKRAVEALNAPDPSANNSCSGRRENTPAWAS